MNSELGRLAFPTTEHFEAAETIGDYFSKRDEVDTVLVVNSCARGQAVPGSDLDFAILVHKDLKKTEIGKLERQWNSFASKDSSIFHYKSLSRYHGLHLDIIEGIYQPTIVELGASSDYFELEIGNQICYSAVYGSPGNRFLELRNQWLPYYSADLREQRLIMLRETCLYDIARIPHYVKRGLYFQALDTLSMAFRKYLQVLFVVLQTYPIAYNKWIKYQIVDILGLPELYPRLPEILSVRNLESAELIEKSQLLNELLAELHEPNI